VDADADVAVDAAQALQLPMQLPMIRLVRAPQARWIQHSMH